jgi:hypothetical protein
MPLRAIETFIDHPATKVADAAAVATSAALVVPSWREALHEAGILAGDIAPIFAVVWLAVQIVCKIVVTVKLR